MQLSSLVAAVAAVSYAHLLCVRVGVSKAAEAFALAFIALDHSQVFFGMSGMETQLATALLLASAYYVYLRSWRAAGVTCGLTLLARPDFLLWVAAVALVALAWDGAFFRVAGYTTLVYGPWLVLATVYFGSPVPHTIVAKSFYESAVAHHSAGQVLESYLASWWTVLAPFKDFWFTVHTPVPVGVLEGAAALFLLFILVGSVAAGQRFRGLLPVVAYLVLFFVYRSALGLSSYFMWYLPPVTALGAVLPAVGIDRTRLRLPRVTEVAAAAMAALFAITVPWMMPLDRTTQVAIDEGVRGAIGRYLNRAMGPRDSVAVEPLGYIGWYAPNKVYYDYPGLSSETATNTLARLPRDEQNLSGLIHALHPTYAVLRPTELATFRALFPADARGHRVVRVFAAAPGLHLRFLGLTYMTTDSEFFLLKSRSPAA